MNRNHRLFRGMLAGWLACSLMLVALPAARGTEPVDFTKQILPLLRKHCVACHNNKTAEGGLILENHEALMRGGDSGATISTDAATTSLLVDRITGAIEPIMPPEGNSVGAKPWTAEEVQLLKQWIA
ncbi:MAG: c-type cytochrome domain-containing protein, partial [Pirellulaceae bacterium]